FCRVVGSKKKKCWGLDATGNWWHFREADSGSGIWSLVQERTANPVNEITAITSDVGPTWAPPSYDAIGNMTMMPQPVDPELSLTAVYDAWNRLVKLSSGGSQV